MKQNEDFSHLIIIKRSILLGPEVAVFLLFSASNTTIEVLSDIWGVNYMVGAVKNTSLKPSNQINLDVFNRGLHYR